MPRAAVTLTEQANVLRTKDTIVIILDKLHVTRHFIISSTLYYSAFSVLTAYA